MAPTISRFYGIKIEMRLRGKEHNPPHVHAIYGEYAGSFRLSDGKFLRALCLKKQKN